jgi:hypothetical protein
MSTLDKKYYHNIDLDSNELKSGRIYNLTDTERNALSSSLTTTDKGYIVYDTTALSLYIWDGSGWTTAAGGSGTVTSVSAGTGMSFTTITGSGPVSIDTSKVPYLFGGFSTGLLKWDGSAWVFDNSTYLTGITSGQVTTALGYTPVTNARTLTINGTIYDLTADRTWSVGTVTSVGATGPITSSSGTTPIISTSMDANKLIGRSSAGTGVMEQITVGTGLTLSGGTLTNNAPDQTIVLTAGTGITTSGTYPNFTITNASPSSGGTVTSVGLSMPSAFSVSSSPITTSGTIAVTGAGTTSQYVRGDGSLATYNPGAGGGGASVSYYLNGSVNQTPTIGGLTYKQMNKVPVIGAGTDFIINADGYIQSFITDVGTPNQLLIPAGNWNFEMYFSASSAGGTPSFYVELYKWDGTTLTSIASSSANPEGITNGTAIDLYITALAVPQTILLATDRIAIRVYVIHSSKTIKLHTEDSHLCQVITTFSTGITALNGLTDQVQYFATPGNTGTSPNWSSVSPNHTLNIPLASTASVTAGLISKTDYDTFTGKQANITGAATTITSSNLTVSKALVSNASGKVAVSATTDTELGYVSGVTSGIQNQLGGKLTSTLTSANIFVGNSSNVATGVALSGDATISNTGSLTIAAKAVTLPKMADLASYTIIGNNTGTSVTPKALTGTEVTAMLPMFSDTSIGLVPAATLGLSPYLFLAANRTWQKIGTTAIADQPKDTLIGNDTGSSAPPTAILIADLTPKLLTLVGDDGSTTPTKGLVPAPEVGDAAGGKFLKADGTWTKPITSYVHTQNTSSTTWNITHNLYFFPNVIVINSTGDKIFGDISYTNNTSLILTFSAAVSGTAYLS